MYSAAAKIVGTLSILLWVVAQNCRPCGCALHSIGFRLEVIEVQPSAALKLRFVGPCDVGHELLGLLSESFLKSEGLSAAAGYYV